MEINAILVVGMNIYKTKTQCSQEINLDNNKISYHGGH